MMIDVATAINVTIQAIQTLIELEPEIMAGVSDLKLFATNLYRGIRGEPISDQELADLEARVDELHAELQSDDE